MEERLSKSDLVGQVDLKILSSLRKNSRDTLTNISRVTGIPISSVFDRLKRLEAIGVIKKHTSLLDMKKIGIHTRVIILFKTKERVKKEFESWLMENELINTLVKVSGGWTIMAEALFKDTGSLESFMEKCEKSFDLREISVLHILKDLKRESFLPKLCGL
jgi:Lrp/AsnC family leucine-responsive transcriptional regulator